MATLSVDVGAPYAPNAINLGTAQTGNARSTNTIDRGGRTGPALLQIVTTIGATPTCTYSIDGSIDGTNWFSIPYSDPATPTTAAVATFAVTTATTTRKYLLSGYPWRYLSVNMTANTNVTSTIDVWVF